jgi:RimJ/RimL family protein N-acetyltransferase
LTQLAIVSGEHVARFVSEGIGFGLTPPYIAIGTEKNGALINGCLLNMYEGADIHATIYGHGWTRGFLVEVGRYVFDTLRCERITVQTEFPEIVRIAERLGGKVEGLKRSHFGPGRDAFLVGILREEYMY